MYLTENILKDLININPHNAIDEEVAERQFQIILKGFNHLYNHSNFLYLADEVGLGKTYVALAVASLLRHFSENPDSYQSIVLVPRKNLQYKWQKDLNNFMRNNYIRADNIVKTVSGETVAEQKLYQHLEMTQKNTPAFFIYRNSSFSIASSDEDENWKYALKARLPVEKQGLFDKICRKLKGENDILIKRAYGYILNTICPRTELVIVDEAHNYKHGIQENVSIRNQIVSRMFRGYMDENDIELLNNFPELKSQITPRVKNLLFLSATPIDKSLIEVKQQMDCFLDEPHNMFAELDSLDQQKAEEVIREKINKFMIRGVMNIRINENDFSRNQYRFEHRCGNVCKTEKDQFQTLTDNLQALIMGLVQYKTIRELKQKNNNSFEMGLLAGFESFGGKSKYENTVSYKKREQEAFDQGIIEKLAGSYRKEFNEHLPHPKQDKLADVLFESMKKQEKSLVFVRRIASVVELERKLSDRYCNYLIDKVKNIKGSKSNKELDKLFKSFKERSIREDVEKIFEVLAGRLVSEFNKEEKLEFINYYQPDEENALQMFIRSDLKELYDADYEEVPEDVRQDLYNYVHLIKDHGKKQRKTVNFFLKKISKKLLFSVIYSQINMADEKEKAGIPKEERENEEKTPYFFHRYFLRKGKNFKIQSYKKDWYEINYLLIGEEFDLFDINYEMLSEPPVSDAQKPTEVSLFRIAKDKIEDAIRSGVKKEGSPDPFYRKETFMTHLLLNPQLCRQEFENWLESKRNILENNHYTRFFDELENLCEILKGVLRNGSGVVPAYVAYSFGDFKDQLSRILKSEFDFVLDELRRIIIDYNKILDNNFPDASRIRYTLFYQLPVDGVSGHHKKDVSKSAVQFRMPGYPYVLIATDILKEGEDLHLYCNNLYHYGIAWNPSDMEQRNGRIDRLDSLTYRQIMEKKDDIENEIPFEHKMQVFYPYLRDTLEVNQIVKLFEGMNKFINIFYKEISQDIELSPYSSTDTIVDVNNIPQQKTDKLISNYDHDCFYIGDFKTVEKPLKPRELRGATEEKLLDNIKFIYRQLLNNDYNFHVPPELDEITLNIRGVLCIPENNRRGPFRIYFRHDVKNLGVFRIHVESSFGRINQLKKTQFDEIDQILRDDGIQIVKRNHFFWLQKKLPLHDDGIRIEDIGEIINFIKYTDQLEEQYYLESDESGFST